MEWFNVQVDELQYLQRLAGVAKDLSTNQPSIFMEKLEYSFGFYFLLQLQDIIVQTITALKHQLQ